MRRESGGNRRGRDYSHQCERNEPKKNGNRVAKRKKGIRKGAYEKKRREEG